MKIIDLLNKIANGEEVPKKIKYQDEIYTMDDLEYFYCKSENRTALFEYIFDNYNDYDALNEEIIILDNLEEKKKLPEKLENEKEFYAYTRYEKNIDEIDKVLYILRAINLTEEKIDNLNNSINSIIDYLKSKGE